MLDTLPQWDLTHLYDDEGKGAYADLDKVRAALAEVTSFEGKLDKATPSELVFVIERYQALAETFSRILSHADLKFAADMSDPKTGQYAQDMRETISALSSKLLFVELELGALPDAHYQAALTDPDFYHYQPWMRVLRASAPYQLEPRLEQMLVERAPTGRGAWVRLFDETSTALQFPFQDGVVTEAEILNHMTSTTPSIRREAGLSLSSVMAENQRPVSSRNVANDVDDSTVDALCEAVNARTGEIAHRYYQLKARWMGTETIDWWDRNAPLPGDDDRRYSWDDAKAIVLDAFVGFDPEMAAIARRFFDEGWIDAGVRSGKASGAFSHPTVPSAHPFILMNFNGKARDVMTLAHEMGHGIHQVLAAEKGYLMADTPLTLAETASVFAEMLAFQALVHDAASADARRFLLAGKVEDMLNTVVRQIAFHNFETKFHEARRSGELSSKDMSDIWMETQTAALGPAIRLDDDYRPVWAYIPHFVHTPFYVYAYAFGDCLVNALWQSYQTRAEDDRQMFVNDYRGLLMAGGTQRYDEALAPFGLDATKPSFWHLGLDMIADMITELEEL